MKSLLYKNNNNRTDLLLKLLRLSLHAKPLQEIYQKRLPNIGTERHNTPAAGTGNTLDQREDWIRLKCL